MQSDARRLWRMFTLGTVIALAVIAVMTVTTAHAQDFLIETIDVPGADVGRQASINWSTGQVTVTGAAQVTGGMTSSQGRLLALPQAETDALFLLAEIINSIEIVTGVTIGDFAEQDSAIAEALAALFDDSLIVAGSETSDFTRDANLGTTTITIDATLSLYGDNGIAAIILPDFQTFFREEMASGNTLPYAVAAPVYDDWQARAASQVPASQVPASQVQGDYTGLVIDASEFAVNPAMCPEIMQGSGDKVYDILSVDPEDVAEQGVATYFASVDSAVADPRVGDNPLVIPAVAIEERDGVLTGHPVISAEDAERIRLENDLSGFLEDGNVTVASRNVVVILTDDETERYVSR